jgi:hypothetical protein
VIVSRRRLEERNTRQAAHIDRLTAERDAFKEDARVTASALEQVAGELSRAKDVVASHITAAGHPSTVLHDVKSFAVSLEQALTDAGVDIRLELARTEGADL